MQLDNLMLDENLEKLDGNEQKTEIFLTLDPLKVIYLLLSFLFYFFIINYIFLLTPKSIPLSNENFSGLHAAEYWKNLTRFLPNRLYHTISYNESYEYLYSRLKKFKDDSFYFDQIEIKIEEQTGNVENEYIKILGVRNLLFTIIPNGFKNPPLAFFSHFDTVGTGVGAYDDGSGVVLQLELIDTIIRSKTIPKSPLMFVFIGTEEFGLQGSQLFITKKTNISSFINMDSMGPYSPLYIWQKTKNSSQLMDIVSSHWGLIILNNDVSSGNTDAHHLKLGGFDGIESMFNRDVASYHTKKDSMGSPDDLQKMGNIIFDIAKNYDVNITNKEINYIGLTPLVFKCSVKMESLLRILFIICLVISF